MANLEKQITRDMEVCENKDGYWYYRITEGDTPILESDLYQTSVEAYFDGRKMLDDLHEARPLLCNHIPSTRDTLIVYSGGRDDG